MDDSNKPVAAVIYVSDNCLGTQHSALWPRRRVVMQRQTNCLQIAHPPGTAQGATRRHFAIRSQGRARSARYKDGSSGGAASVIYKPTSDEITLKAR